MPEGNESNETIQEMVREMVRANGDEVATGTEKCVSWRSKHSNCVGCSSELGCRKVVRLILDDSVRTGERPQEILDRILKAKTVDELKAIPWPFKSGIFKILDYPRKWNKV